MIFGHAGITLGLCLGLNRVAAGKWSFLRKGDSEPDGRRGASRCAHEGKVPSWAAGVRRVDYRLVLVGSMLPDIIDKPIGHYFFLNTFNSGRIFAHTLLFFFLLLGVGILWLRQRHGAGPLVLALSTGSHLVLDEMWGTTRTLFWPLQGWSFPKSPDITPFGDWLSELWHGLRTEPDVYGAEFLGFAILALVAFKLLQSRSVRRFLRSGALAEGSPLE